MRRLLIPTLALASLGLLAVPLIAQNPLRSNLQGSPLVFFSDEQPEKLTPHAFGQFATPVRQVPTFQEAIRRPGGQATSAAGNHHVVESQSFTVVSTTYKLANAAARNALVAFLNEHLGKPGLFEIASKDDDKITVLASPQAQKTIGDLIVLMKQSPRTTQPETGGADGNGGYPGQFLDNQPSR